MAQAMVSDVAAAEEQIANEETSGGKRQTGNEWEQLPDNAGAVEIGGIGHHSEQCCSKLKPQKEFDRAFCSRPRYPRPHRLCDGGSRADRGLRSVNCARPLMLPIDLQGVTDARRSRSRYRDGADAPY
jgi:hypothetical protein